MLSLHQNLKGLVRVKFHHLYHMTKNKLAIFDFDGTISKIDSTKFFLKISFGKIHFFYGYYLRFIHLFILSKFGTYDFIKLKEKRISFFLKNINLKKFN